MVLLSLSNNIWFYKLAVKGYAPQKRIKSGRPGLNRESWCWRARTRERSKTTGKKLNNTHITTYLNNNSFHNNKKHLLNRKYALETYEVYWLYFLYMKNGNCVKSSCSTNSRALWYTECCRQNCIAMFLNTDYRTSFL